MPKEKRPKVLKGETIRCKVGCGNLYITLNHLDDNRYNQPPLNEIWIEPGFKAKDDDDITTYCVKSFLIPISRLITFIIRRIDESERGDFIRQIHKHECPKRNVTTAKSCVDAIA